MKKSRNSKHALKAQIDALLKFPDQNPNPVIKTTMSGEIVYANSSGSRIIGKWGLKIKDYIPSKLFTKKKKEFNSTIELEVDNKTFSFHIVPVPEFNFINIYGTDITAIKVLAKFPDQNPNPVIKVSAEGKLLYRNLAASYMCDYWNLNINDKIPAELMNMVLTKTNKPIEMCINSKTFSFTAIAVPEFNFINIYATDITAAMDNQLILQKLAKYFSPQVYQSIFSGELDVQIKTSRKRLTIFFSDIKGFSELTERLEPEVLTELITNYLTEMTKIAMKHGGTVDKYIGDAIMVFFGAPQSKGLIQDAISCVLMAISMKDALIPLRLSWEQTGISQPLDIRIGIHTDTCTVGNFGSNDRLDYTTIGNGVNLASRLESSAETNQILISEDTYLLIKEKIRCRKRQEIRVKNITHPIQTYEVIGTIDTEKKTKRKLEVETPGFSLFLDPSLIAEKTSSRKILEQALKLLNKKE